MTQASLYLRLSPEPVLTPFHRSLQPQPTEKFNTEFGVFFFCVQCSFPTASFLIFSTCFCSIIVEKILFKMIKLLLIGIIYIFHSHSCEDEHGNRRIHQFFVQTIAPDVIADAVLKGVIPTHQVVPNLFFTLTVVMTL